MRQIKKPSNQSVFLDPEKVYFVEKFGYLLKKIDSGFGGPIQEALYQRIFTAVDKFKTDLPVVVHDLEKKRLINTGKCKIAKSPKKPVPVKKTTKPTQKKQPDVIKKKIVATKTKSEVAVRKVIETEIEIELNAKEQPVIPKPVEPSMPTTSGSSILRPSAATIREENRQRQIQKVKQKPQIRKEEMKKPAPLVTRPKTRPKKELTVWERAWHRYGGYSEETMNGHT